jgi:hypothetical protein
MKFINFVKYRDLDRIALILICSPSIYLPGRAKVPSTTNDQLLPLGDRDVAR